MRILLSKNAFEFSLPELRLPDGRILPAVYLPKKQYRPTEVMANGPRKGFPPRAIAELTDIEVERIMASELIKGLIANGTYEWVDKVPESLKTSEDLVSELREENARLKAAQTPVVPVAAVVEVATIPEPAVAVAEEIVLEEPAPAVEKPKSRRGKSKESAGPVDTDSIENDGA
jgi:hypothetical protein